MLSYLVIGILIWHGRYQKFHNGVLALADIYCQSNVAHNGVINNAVMALFGVISLLRGHNAVFYKECRYSIFRRYFNVIRKRQKSQNCNVRERGGALWECHPEYVRESAAER